MITRASKLADAEIVCAPGAHAAGRSSGIRTLHAPHHDGQALHQVYESCHDLPTYE